MGASCSGSHTSQGRRLHVGYPFPYTRHAQLLHEFVGEGRLGTVLTATGAFRDLGAAALPRQGRVDDGRKRGNPLAGRERDVQQPEPRWRPAPHAGDALRVAALLPQRACDRGLSSAIRRFDTSVDVWDGIVFKTTPVGGGNDHEHRHGRRPRAAGGGVSPLRERGPRTRSTRAREHFGSSSTASRARWSLRPSRPHELYPAQAPATRLVDAIVGDAPVVATGELGLLTVELLAAARASSKAGRTGHARARRDTCPATAGGNP